jgi:hypothetical protein
MFTSDVLAIQSPNKLVHFSVCGVDYKRSIRVCSPHLLLFSLPFLSLSLLLCCSLLCLCGVKMQKGACVCARGFASV